jgi:hypothetical protein
MGEKNANGNGIHGGCGKFFIGRQGLTRDFSYRFFAVRGWKNEARIQTAQRGHTRCGCPIHKHTHSTGKDMNILGLLLFHWRWMPIG